MDKAAEINTDIDKTAAETTRRILDRSRHPVSVIPEEAFSRIAEAPLVRNNGVRILKDAAENYPAWLEAIENAERYIHFESYIIHEDEQGEIFARALIKKAGEGVKVRLIYDWLGGLGSTSGRFWKMLRDGGVEVRCFNYFDFTRPLAWVSRDHRKTIVVDGEVAFVTGLCVGRMWVGDPEKGIEPWRDTGVEIYGPAVADVDRAFADVWDDLGTALPDDEIADAGSLTDEGSVSLRIVASKPGMARTYRLDQLIGAMSRESLWLTDAYFAGSAAYIETLRSAAMDGVDVRLLLPASTDIAVMQTISRSGYRGLLEAGVRIYEWNGPMIHAKTAVVDGFWSRIGSTNLNVASWLTNCELDVLVEDHDLGARMQQMFLADLKNATEITLNEKHRPRPVSPREHKRPRGSSSSTSGRFAPSAIAIGNALVSTISTSRKRFLGATEARINLIGGILLLVTGIVAFRFPRILAFPLGLIAIWLAISLFIASVKLFRRPGNNKAEKPKET
jgi:cardiolipin synthase